MSTTQRRKAVSSRGDSPPRTTTTAEPTLPSPAALPSAPPVLVQKPPAVATVRRRKWGTSPFDENWLNLDCCGLFCALITYGLHLYGCHVVCFILIPPWMSYSGTDNVRHMSLWGYAHCLAFCSVAVLAILSHFKAMTTDPGAVPPDAKPLPDPEELVEEGKSSPLGEGAAALNASSGEEQSSKNGATVTTTTKKVMLAPRGRRLCRRCNAFKPERAHHCSVCRRCIIKMDHHCPWVNNCVGIGNHKYFLLFIFYTCLSCLYSLSLVVTRFLVCMNARHVVVGAAAAVHRHARVRYHCLDEPTHLLNIIGLLVEAVLFGMFTSCMMVDQWDVVMTNMTHIDRLKGDSKLRSSVIAERVPGVMEVFGMGQHHKGGRVSRRFRSDWFSPCAKVSFPSTVRDEVFGYCRPCSGSGGGSDDDTTALLELASSGSGRMVRSVAEIV